jgi:peptide/nickel transport system substrate-binding protein
MNPRDLVTRTRLRTVAATATVVAAVLALSACSPTASTPAATTSVSIGDVNETFSFSPSSQDRLATSLAYDFLFTQDAKGYHPRAATSSYNTGNTVLTITLRKGLKFADGSAIDADVIKANILWSKKNGAFFSAIKDVRTVDTQTVVVDQSRADKNVMLSMFAMPIVSPATLENPDRFAASPNESGPYLLDPKSSTSGSTYRFQRNPKYWGAKSYPYKSVTVKLLADETSRINALKSGQIDAAPIGATTAADAKATGLRINQLYAGTAGMILGDRQGKILKPLGDVRVRRAMNMAFDRKAMVKSIYSGYAEASSQPFQAGTPGYQKNGENTYAYDPAGAKALLRQAGYANGFDLTLPTYTPLTKTTEAYVKQALGDIGIRVTYKAFNDDTWVGAFSGGKYPIANLGLPFAQAVDVADPNFFWNPWHNTDPKAVALLKQINVGSPAQVVGATNALGKIELDDAWWVIWAHPATLYASAKNVQVSQPQYADWVTIREFHPAS